MTDDTEIVEKLNDNTIKITSSKEIERTYSINSLVNQKNLLQSRIQSYDIRCAADRAVLVNKLNEIDSIIEKARIVGIVL